MDGKIATLITEVHQAVRVLVCSDLRMLGRTEMRAAASPVTILLQVSFIDTLIRRSMLIHNASQKQSHYLLL